MNDTMTVRRWLQPSYSPRRHPSLAAIQRSFDLVAHKLVWLGRNLTEEERLGGGTIDVAHRPDGVPANQRNLVCLDDLLKEGEVAVGAAVAEGDGCVAGEPGAFGAEHRRTAIGFPEFGFGHGKQPMEAWVDIVER